MKPSWKAGLAVTGAYLVLVLAVTLPSILELGQGTLGEPGLDKQNHLWDFWWWWTAARDPSRSFFFTDLLYYPSGTSLWQANSGFLLFFFGLIPQALGFNLEATYDLVVMASLLFSCIGGHVLGARLFQHRGVGFFCGVATAFNPLVFHNINLALVEFVNLGFAMLFLTALHSLTTQASRRAALLAVLWFILAATWSWYMGLLLVLLAAIHVPLTLGLRGAMGDRRRLLLLAATALAMGLFLLPFHQKIGVGSVEGRIMQVEHQVVEGMSGRRSLLKDEARFLAPEAARLNIRDKLCVGAMEVKLITSIDPVTSLVSSGAANGNRMAAFFPLNWAVLILLAGVGLLLRWRRWSLGCVGVIVFSVLLSLGPCLVLNNKIYWGSCSVMPFSLLDEIVPGMSRIQFPQRLAFLGIFALVMLAGSGLRALLDRSRPDQRRRWVLILSCAALLLLSNLNMAGLPLQRGEILAPEIYQQEARAPRGRALVEVPLSLGAGVTRASSSSLFTFYQTIHGQPIYTGPIPEYLLSNVSPPDMVNNALLQRIRVLEAGPPFPPLKPGDEGAISQGMDALLSRRFRHILVHTEALTPQTAQAINGLLSQVVGLPRTDESNTDDPLNIFTLPVTEEGLQ